MAENAESQDAAIPAGTAFPEPVCRRAMRIVIIGTCWKIISAQVFTNGIMLLFLNSLELSGSTVVFLLSLYSLLQATLLLPSAHISDKYGKLRIGLTGIAVCLAGFAIIPLTGAIPIPATFCMLMLVVGIGLYGAGAALQMGGYFALVSDVVPEDGRGRFFSRMRASWQATGIIICLLVTVGLPANSPRWLLCLLLCGVGLSIVPWWFYYRLIPEKKIARPETEAFLPSLLAVARQPSYAPFCSYVFIIALFTGGCPVLFGLVEKKVLNLPDGQVVLLANMTLIGCLAGYWLGGWAVDRFGTKPLFLVCHFTYGTVLGLFLLRDLLGLPIVPALGGIHFLFGLPLAASSIAISTEMLALAPQRHKSLSTSLCQAFSLGGAAASGVLVSWALQVGIFSSDWTLANQPRNSYDAAILICAVMIVGMTVTLGLVPSVIGRLQGLPREL